MYLGIFILSIRIRLDRKCVNARKPEWDATVKKDSGKAFHWLAGIFLKRRKPGTRSVRPHWRSVCFQAVCGQRRKRLGWHNRRWKKGF